MAKKRKRGKRHGPSLRDKRWVQMYLWHKCNGRCEYCRKRMTKQKGELTKDTDATIDHIIPKSKGGNYHLENLALACYQCNRKKGSKRPDMFMAHMPVEKVLA